MRASINMTNRSAPHPSNAVDPSDEADRNGKDKYQRHGSVMESAQRWTARNGKVIVICATIPVFSVFLIPPLKLLMRSQPSTPPPLRVSTNTVTSQPQQRTLQIPPCPSSPWKEDEILQGKCPGDLKPNGDAKTLSHCASSCCDDDNCISWQYRDDVGCLQGKDIRLGQEKDGPAAWCSDHPPHRWQGQFLKPRAGKKDMDEREVRSSACDVKSWDPDEEVGQCFGLGDVKKDASGSAEECMAACCADEKCGAWQWNKELGCFYGKGMHSCQGNGDPIEFEPFEGRRKRLESRGYTDKRGKPWQMDLA